MSNTKVYEMVTDRIVAALEEGTIPWEKPWNPTVGQPRSLSSGKPYRGINVILLGIASMLGSYGSPWWGTYKEIARRGGQVRKGEKSTMVTFWKSGTREVEDANTGETKDKRFLILRSYLVFNADQADGLETPEVEGLKDHDPIAEAEAILHGYVDREDGLSLSTGVDAAWYSPSMDLIGLPDLGAFVDAESYYGAAFHEATHSTGHRSRLAREGVIEGHKFGDELYAKEELVAEMGSAMLSGVVGIEGPTLGRSAAYLASWISVLKGDPKMLVSAASAAQRAADRILGASDEPASSEAE